MLAVVCMSYGGPEVAQVRDVPEPVPTDNEVLVRVHAFTVTSGDCRMRASNFPSGFWLPARLMLGVRRPRQPILGTACAGTVEAIGARVAKWRTGDPVVVFSGVRFGCHAQFTTMKEDGALALRPAGFTFEQAAAIPFGGATALYFLRDIGKVKGGERVLVNGASGSVGSAAVQLAKHFGAHVTGVCSAANAGLVRSLGADEMIDYNSIDFANAGERWDIILDTIGNAPFSRCRAALNENGRLLLIAAGLADLVKAPFQSKASGLTVAGGPAPERADDLALLAGLCEQGAFKPVIDGTYPLARVVEAFARADSGRKTGDVVVSVAQS